MIHIREFYILKENIYKFGRSNILENRVKQYPNGSKVLLTLECKNSKSCEKDLLKIFKTKFIQSKFYGTEYFKGNCYDMIKEICEYINNIQKSNVNNIPKSNVKNIIENNIDNILENVIKNSIENNIEEKNKDRTCPKCNQCFKYPSILKTHMKTSFHCITNTKEIENIILINKKIKKKKNSIIKCYICDKIFKSNSSLVRHKKNIKCSNKN